MREWTCGNPTCDKNPSWHIRKAEYLDEIEGPRAVLEFEQEHPEFPITTYRAAHGAGGLVDVKYNLEGEIVGWRLHDGMSEWISHRDLDTVEEMIDIGAYVGVRTGSGEQDEIDGQVGIT